MINMDAAYDLFDVLVDMLKEYEYDAKCHEQTDSQRDLIIRARNAIKSFSPDHAFDPLYWEDHEEEEVGG